MDAVLPPEVLLGSQLRGNEYGWNISSFLEALAAAEAYGYACLGGRFQFRLEDGTTCEMYWLNADSEDRSPAESWVDYAHRSCSEVLTKFQDLVSAADFKKEAATWPTAQIDPTRNLVFVGNFVTEAELVELAKKLRPIVSSTTFHGVG